MPKIPRGIFKRAGRGYYCRIHAGGRDRWVALGATLSRAVRRFHQVKAAPTLSQPQRTTVAKLARECLNSEPGQPVSRRVPGEYPAGEAFTRGPSSLPAVA